MKGVHLVPLHVIVEIGKKECFGVKVETTINVVVDPVIPSDRDDFDGRDLLDGHYFEALVAGFEIITAAGEVDFGFQLPKGIIVHQLLHSI